MLRHGEYTLRPTHMNNKKKFSLIFFLLVISANVFAFNYPTKNRFLIGINAYHRDYKEELPPPKKSNEAGQLYGLALGFERKYPNSFMANIELSIDAGTTDYDGSLQSFWGEYLGPHQDKTNNAFINLDTIIGYTFAINEHHLLTPLIGLNSHTWGRGLPGVNEVYLLQSGVIGLQYDYMKSDRIQYGIQFKLLPVYDALITIETYDYSRELELGKKVNYEIAFPIAFKTKPTCKNLWRVTPYYRMQRIGHSEFGWITSSIWVAEPASKNHVFGIKILYMPGF